MTSVRVSLKDRSYPIFVGRGALKEAGCLLRGQGLLKNRALIVSQKPIASLYGKILTDSLAQAGFEISSHTVPFSKSSEAAKSEAVYLKLIRQMVRESGKNRSLFLVALGGGVIGDITGFAASVYRRGIPYVQIPTTLTAQVDSAIGGKTAIDLPEGKNLLGTIYQPKLVLSDPSVLFSLPERHWSDGFAEVIKYGVIEDLNLFSLLEKNGKDGIKSNVSLLEKVILRAAAIKAKFVERDEFDRKDIRILLNFGHTTGHAIETVSGFSGQYTHGEGVAIGMLVACEIAEALGILRDKNLVARLEKTLLKFGLPLFFKGLDTSLILNAMGYDKKSQMGKNRFVLPVAFGKMAIVKEVPTEIIAQALKRRKN
jgi:3-dehydroquinate synthase